MARSKSQQSLESRLSSIEAELMALKNTSPVRTAGFDQLRSFQSIVTLKAHFGRVALERKPFVVTLGGVSKTLTTVITAILLVLLMDLLERSESGKTNGDNLARVKLALSRISSDDGLETTDDAVRVALYRAGQFIDEEFSASVNEDMTFSVEKGLLVLRQKGIEIDPGNIEVEITTSDQVISSFLDQTLATSPLARLRKAKALYVPGGNDGQDRLLMELLDHSYPTKQTCLFYRPTMQSFSSALLNKMNVSPRRRQRQEIASRAYQRGTLQYCEVLPKKLFMGIGTPFTWERL